MTLSIISNALILKALQEKLSLMESRHSQKVLLYDNEYLKTQTLEKLFREKTVNIKLT